jgi:GntR family transcriptional regulator/MocR family aminotransferase
MPIALLDSLILDRTAKRSLQNHGPLVDKAPLAAFSDGAFYTHIRSSRRAYSERQHVFLETARRIGLPLTFSHTDGGMNLFGSLPAGTDDGRVSRRLEKAGFDVPALSDYALRRPAPGLVFGYTAFEPTVLRREVSRLAAAMKQS